MGLGVSAIFIALLFAVPVVAAVLIFFEFTGHKITGQFRLITAAVAIGGPILLPAHRRNGAAGAQWLTFARWASALWRAGRMGILEFGLRHRSRRADHYRGRRADHPDQYGHCEAHQIDGASGAASAATRRVSVAARPQSHGPLMSSRRQGVFMSGPVNLLLNRRGLLIGSLGLVAAACGPQPLAEAQPPSGDTDWPFRPEAWLWAPSCGR